MRTLLTLILLSVVALTSCDEGRQMAGDIINEPVATEPVMPDLGTQVAVTYSVYDVNQDGKVSNVDLALVSAALGQTNPDNPRLDVDQSGAVDGNDLILIGNNFGGAPTTDLMATETPVATQTPTEAPVAEPEYLELTLDNALSLTPGVYKFRPSSYTESDEIIGTLEWGSVDAWGDPIIGADYPADAPKISVAIELKREPYLLQLDSTRTIGFARLDTGEFIVDELIVEIGQELRRGTGKGGPRGNRYDWTWIVYEGTALENASNPERLFEYE